MGTKGFLRTISGREILPDNTHLLLSKRTEVSKYVSVTPKPLLAQITLLSLCYKLSSNIFTCMSYLHLKLNLNITIAFSSSTPLSQKCFLILPFLTNPRAPNDFIRNFSIILNPSFPSFLILKEFKGLLIC